MADLTQKWWFQLINIPILISILFIINEFIFRRSTEITLWLSVLSLISIPIYAMKYTMDWIQFVTLIVLCLSILLVTFYRYSHHKSEYIKSKLFAINSIHKWSIFYFKFSPNIKILICALCIIDLLLTSIKELLNSFHYNAVCGLFLCFTVPLPLTNIDPPFWRISSMNKKLNERNDLIITFSFGWIISYTSFIACYVYANYFNGFVRGIALLFIPLMPIIFNYEKGINLWAQNRLYTLWFYYIFKVFSFNVLNDYMYCTDDWRLLSDKSHYDLIVGWGLINAILSCLHFLYWIFHLSEIPNINNVNNIINKKIINDLDQNEQDIEIEEFEIDDESKPILPASQR